MGIGEPDFAGYIKNAWDESSFRVAPYGGRAVRFGLFMDRDNILNNHGFRRRCSCAISFTARSRLAMSAVWGQLRHPISATDKLRFPFGDRRYPPILEELNPKTNGRAEYRTPLLSSSGMLFNEFDTIFHDIFNRTKPKRIAK